MTSFANIQAGETLYRRAFPYNVFAFLKVLDDHPDKDLGKIVLVRDTKTNEKIKLYEKELTKTEPTPKASY